MDTYYARYFPTQGNSNQKQAPPPTEIMSDMKMENIWIR